MKTLSLVFMILGTFLGAGFVSGKEIATYFSCYGVGGVFGIIFATILFFVLIYFFLSVSSYVNSFSFFTTYYFGKFSKFITMLFMLCLLILISSMFAGNRELANILHIDKWVVIILTTLLCFAIVLKNVKGISVINLIFMPIILIVLLINCLPNKIILPSTMQNCILPIFSGINYIFINIVSLGVFIVEIGCKFSKKQKIIASIISSAVVGIFLLIINNSIYGLGIEYLSMPMLYISKSKNLMLYTLTIISIWVGLFTTLISCVFVVSNYINLYIKQKVFSIILTLLLGIVFSFIGFDIIVGYVYWIISGVGVLMVFKMLFKEKETHKIYHCDKIL